MSLPSSWRSPPTESHTRHFSLATSRSNLVGVWLVVADYGSGLGPVLGTALACPTAHLPLTDWKSPLCLAGAETSTPQPGTSDQSGRAASRSGHDAPGARGSRRARRSPLVEIAEARSVSSRARDGARNGRGSSRRRGLEPQTCRLRVKLRLSRKDPQRH